MYLLLLGSLAFKIFLESFTLRYWGDFFLALALCFSLEFSTRRRSLFLILAGIVEGFFSPLGILAGIVSAIIVLQLQIVLSRNLDFSSWYPSVFALGISLFFFKFILHLLMPYLIELSLPASCFRLFLWDFGLTYAWVVFFHFLIRKRNSFGGVLVGK